MTTDRFWSKVSVSSADSCWEWKASRGRPGGYGKFRLGKGKVAAHRYSWELKHGPIPDGMCVLHKCDNPGCVNPSHLFLGTQKENIRDRHSKGRSRGASLPGETHPYAKLNWEKVSKIRELKNSGVPQQEVAARFGVSRRAIGMIWSGHTWKAA